MWIVGYVGVSGADTYEYGHLQQSCVVVNCS